MASVDGLSQSRGGSWKGGGPLCSEQKFNSASRGSALERQIERAAARGGCTTLFRRGGGSDYNKIYIHTCVNALAAR